MSDEIFTKFQQFQGKNLNEEKFNFSFKIYLILQKKKRINEGFHFTIKLIYFFFLTTGVSFGC
jgi:hypothetical protein